MDEDTASIQKVVVKEGGGVALPLVGCSVKGKLGCVLLKTFQCTTLVKCKEQLLILHTT